MKAQLLVLGLTLVATATAHADTLVLKNGQRVRGALVGVAGSQVEFEDRSGVWRRVLRIGREEIARIEFDNGDDRVTSDRAPEREAPGTAIPRGMRERQVNVVGNVRWSDTGIQVRQGQAIYFAATGEVRWGGGNGRRRDGAAGEANSPSNHLRPIPDRPAAALIGKIGDGEDIFFIGAESGPFRARESGRLYLGINDDWLEDNSGSLRVNVFY